MLVYIIDARWNEVSFPGKQASKQRSSSTRSSMISLSILAALLLTSSTSCMASVLRDPVRRQSYNFINETQYNGTTGPVEVGVSLKSGGRNQTAPLLYGW